MFPVTEVIMLQQALAQFDLSVYKRMYWAFSRNSYFETEKHWEPEICCLLKTVSA